MPAQISILRRSINLSRRQLIFLVFGLTAVSLALGLILGLILSSYQSALKSNTDLFSNSGNGQTVSLTGTVRRLDNPENSASFYLEKPDKSQILLESKKIDPAFFGIYEGETVTVEGTLGRTSDGKREVLFVEKIVVK